MPNKTLSEIFGGQRQGAGARPPLSQIFGSESGSTEAKPGFIDTAIEQLGRPAAAARRGLMTTLKKNNSSQGEFFGAEKAIGQGLKDFGKSLFGWESTEGAPSGMDILQETKLTPGGYSAKDLVNEQPVKQVTTQALTSLAGPIPNLAARFMAPEAYKKAEDISPQAYGLAVEAAADPLNIPVFEGVKAVGGLLPKTSGFLKNSGARLAETMTGVPKADFLNYIDENEAITALKQKYGSGWKQAFDEFRDRTRGAIDTKRKGLNEQIGATLASTPENASINAQSLFSQLQQERAKLNPALPSEKASMDKIDSMMDMVGSLADEKGAISPQNAYKLQREFWQNSKFTDPATLLPNPEASQRAARGAGVATRSKVADAMPEIADANSKLSQLHGIEDTLSPGLVDNNKAAHSLVRGGTDPNSVEWQQLKQLGDWLGVDLNKEAKQLAAYKRFSDVKLSPFDSTGKANYRMGLGALGGLATFGNSEGSPESRLLKSLGVGAAFSSPRTYKGLIDAGLLAGRQGRKVLKGAQGAMEGLERGGEKLGNAGRGLLKGTKEFIKDEEGAFDPEALRKLLKPGTENTYDLKKAREVVGEPKRGLLDKVEGPADTIDLSSKSTTQRDRFLDYAEELGVNPSEANNIFEDSESHKEALSKLLEASKVTPDQKALASPKARRSDAVDAAARGKISRGMKIMSEEGKSFEVVDINPDTGLVMMKTPDGGTSFEYADTIEEFLGEANPGASVTSLDIEPQKGLMRDKPAEVRGFTRSPGSDYPAAGIPELKSNEVFTAADGKQYKVEQYSHRDPKGGRVYWVNDPNARDWGSSVQKTERELFGDKYKDVFAKEDASRTSNEKMMSDIDKKTKIQFKAVPMGRSPDPGRGNEYAVRMLRLRDDFARFASDAHGDRWLDFSDDKINELKKQWQKSSPIYKELVTDWAQKQGSLNRGENVTNLSVEGGPSSPKDPRFKKGEGFKYEKGITGQELKSEKRGLIKTKDTYDRDTQLERFTRAMQNSRIRKQGEPIKQGVAYMLENGRDAYVKEILEDGTVVVDFGSGKLMTFSPERFNEMTGPITPVRPVYKPAEPGPRPPKPQPPKPKPGKPKGKK